MTFWTDDRKASLRRMSAEGMSAAEAAAELGITKSAVIGASHRNNCLFRSVPPSPSIGRDRVRQDAARMARKPTEKPADRPFCVPLSPCGLLELTPQRCRWPIGDPVKPGFMFCGAFDADLGDGRPYCRAHAHMAYDRRGDRGAAPHAQPPVAEPSSNG